MEKNLKITNAEEYIASQPIEYRETLKILRKIIKTTVAEAKETISYQVICYHYKYMLVGIGTKKGFCSFYVMGPSLVKSMKLELTNVRYSGSTIHFPLKEPLPIDLIKKIIEQRAVENELRFQFKIKS